MAPIKEVGSQFIEACGTGKSWKELCRVLHSSVRSISPGNNPAIALLISGLVVTGCESTMDPDKYQQIMGRYAVLNGHKAIVMNPQSNKIYWVWNSSSPDQALASAKSNCEGESGATCIPVAVNDTQVYDPVPGAVAKQQRNDEINRQMFSTLQTMQTVLGNRR